MKNSKDGTGDKPDGRKNNQPPEHGKIKPGEVRNKWGCAGKPKPPADPTTMDELLWREAARVVSHDVNGPVDAKQRLMQEEFYAALHRGDDAVRARLLSQLHATSARIDHRHNEILTFFIEGKANLTEQFYLAQKGRKPAPDVLPHPDHVQIENGHIEFYGPTDKRGRAQWEHIKCVIRVAAAMHEVIREEYRRTGCPAVLEELKAIEKHRRKYMRVVPKGWNWKEEIYSRDSMLVFAKETAARIKESGYVPSDAVN